MQHKKKALSAQCKKNIWLFLKRNTTVLFTLTDPGCKNSVNGSEEWLKRNLASFSLFATLEELKNMNEKFSAVSNKEILYKQNILKNCV